MSESHGEAAVHAELSRLVGELSACAAGIWVVEGDHLVQRAFVPGARLDPATARSFAEATRVVPLSRRDLGIVQALHGGATTVTRVREAAPDRGSGYWLRAFGADRSVAVPISTRVVVSIAMRAEGDDGAIAARLGRIGEALGGGPDDQASPPAAGG